MTNTGKTCPICNETVEQGSGVCPRCGFTLVGATETFAPVSVQDVAVTPEQSGARPVLRIIKGPYTGQEFVLGDGLFSIGRDPSCDLFLNNTTVSRVHASLVIDGASAKVRDEGSTNGTWLDGNVVDEAPLAQGSVLQIGTFEMVFERKRR